MDNFRSMYSPKLDHPNELSRLQRVMLKPVTIFRARYVGYPVIQLPVLSLSDGLTQLSKHSNRRCNGAARHQCAGCSRSLAEQMSVGLSMTPRI